MILRSFLSILLITSVAAAQSGRFGLSPKAATGRPPADEALAVSLQAHGGTRLLEVTTLVLHGASTVGRTAQPITVSASLDGSTRLDYGAPVRRSLVTTPRGRYETNEGRITPRAGHSGVFAQLDILSVLSLRNTLVQGGDRGLIGATELGGRPVVRVRAGAGNQKLFYGRPVTDELDIDFDQQSGLVSAIHRTGFADEDLNRKFVSSYVFADYREVGGVRLPFSITRYLDGDLKETIAVESYTINPVLDRDLFER